MKIYGKKILLHSALICSVLFADCKKTENKTKDNLLKAGAVLVLANSVSSGTTGLTIKIPDGVPLKTNVASNTKEKSLWKFLKAQMNFPEAKASENQWAFVRQSALWANNNTDAIEAVLNPIKKYNLLNSPGTLTTTVQLASGKLYTAKLTVSANTVVSSSAYTGTKTFNHRFEMWRQSDSAKAMEMFFDNADALSDKGILLLYNLNVLDPSSYPDSLVCETYVSSQNVSYLGSTVSSPKQTITWSGTQSFYTGSLGGRVVLEKMDNNTVLCFKSVVRFQHSATFSGCGTGTKYYSLAYSQYLNTSDNKATAKVSLADSSIDNGQTSKICSAYSLNYGLFINKSGFVSDTNAASAVPSDYPSTSRVDTLFSKIGTAGAGTWDDMQKTTLDSLNIKFNLP